MTSARVLGVVLAGGQSRRFGSDKALAMLGGRSLITRAVAGLEAQCATVIVAGRAPGVAASGVSAAGVADRPQAGMGPLGGLCGALHYAAAHRFDAVLSVPVDGYDVPADLIGELSPAPAYALDAPVIGYWPVAVGDTLDALLAEPVVHSMRAFALRIGARAVRLSRPPVNINTPADLIAAQELSHRKHAHGL